jgi:hypothetical protein
MKRRHDTALDGTVDVIHIKTLARRFSVVCTCGWSERDLKIRHKKRGRSQNAIEVQPMAATLRFTTVADGTSMRSP